mgnify:CR=1 FL=1
MTIIATKAIKHIKIPNTAAIDKGAVVNATIPSIAYLNNFQKDHFVSPATLSTFSYSNHLVSKPTKLNNPFEYLLYSFKEIVSSSVVITGARFLIHVETVPFGMPYSLLSSVTPLPALQCRSTICCLKSGVYDFDF